MAMMLQRLRILSRQNMIRLKFRNLTHFSKARNFTTLKSLSPDRSFFFGGWQELKILGLNRWFSGVAGEDERSEDEIAEWLQNIIKFRVNKPSKEIDKALDKSSVELTEQLVLKVLQRHRSTWKPALLFFNWASKPSNGFSPGIESHNEIIDILFKSGQFEEAHQVLDKMPEREVSPNTETYTVLVNRLAEGGKVEEAIAMFDKRRREFGIESDSDVTKAFQTLLFGLCQFKHVEEAETYFHVHRIEFRSDNIKTWNIILNGWRIRKDLNESKRVWRDILRSKSKPDPITFATYINTLVKLGDIDTALKLFERLWTDRLNPDVTAYNSIINGLCANKMIPKALEIFEAMSRRGCEPNTVTYNTIIKYVLLIERFDKAYELLETMEKKKRIISPDRLTYGFFIKSVRRPEHLKVQWLLYRMKKNGVDMNGDTYNMVFRKYMGWSCEERAREIWRDMESQGFGPDERSYSILIHRLFVTRKYPEMVRFYELMKSKGMKPDLRIRKLLAPVLSKLNSEECDTPRS